MYIFIEVIGTPHHHFNFFISLHCVGNTSFIQINRFDFSPDRQTTLNITFTDEEGNNGSFLFVFTGLTRTRESYDALLKSLND